MTDSNDLEDLDDLDLKGLLDDGHYDSKILSQDGAAAKQSLYSNSYNDYNGTNSSFEHSDPDISNADSAEATGDFFVDESFDFGMASHLLEDNLDLDLESSPFIDELRQASDANTPIPNANLHKDHEDHAPSLSQEDDASSGSGFDSGNDTTPPPIDTTGLI